MANGRVVNKTSLIEILKGFLKYVPKVDNVLSNTSTNAIQNKAVKEGLDGKLDKSGGLVSGALGVQRVEYQAYSNTIFPDDTKEILIYTSIPITSADGATLRVYGHAYIASAQYECFIGVRPYNNSFFVSNYSKTLGNYIDRVAVSTVDNKVVVGVRFSKYTQFSFNVDLERWYGKTSPKILKVETNKTGSVQDTQANFKVCTEKRMPLISSGWEDEDAFKYTIVNLGGLNTDTNDVSAVLEGVYQRLVTKYNNSEKVHCFCAVRHEPTYETFDVSMYISRVTSDASQRRIFGTLVSRKKGFYYFNCDSSTDWKVEKVIDETLLSTELATKSDVGHTHGLGNNNFVKVNNSTNLQNTWNDVFDKPISRAGLTVWSNNTTTTSAFSPFRYSSTLAFGATTTKGFLGISHSESNPLFRVGGGTTNSNANNVWYFDIKGANTKTYDLEKFTQVNASGHLVLPNGGEFWIE